MSQIPRVLIGNDLHVYDIRGVFPDSTPGYSLRDAGQVKHLTIHHDGVTFWWRVIARETARINTVYHYHRSTQGWPGIGYHFYVFPRGRIYYTGDWATVRYHTAGDDDPATPQQVSRHNEHGVAICLAGNFQMKPPGVEQLRATARLIANLRFLFSNTELPVVGHRDEADAPQYATSCPGATWESWRAIVS